MAVEYKDYYKILGVSRVASKEEIAKSFKKLARKYHPDFNPDDKSAESRFKDISEAYEVLKDEEKRRLYDQLGPNWQDGQHFQRPPGFEGMQFSFADGGGFQGMGASPFSEFFESLFGGGARTSQSAQFGGASFGRFPQRPAKGQDVESRIQLSLEEAYAGVAKNISLRDPDGSVRTFEVKIPAGVKNGAKIRLAGQGESGGSSRPGDLYLQVQLLPHAHFALDDSDIVYELPVAPWEAVLGAKVRVPTLDGTIELSIPAGTNSGKKFRLRGRGMGSDANKGDQLVRVVIAVPEQLSAEEQALWEQLRDMSSFAAR